MEAELIAVIISCCVSGFLLIWKFLKRLRKSKCYIENDKGEKIVFDFGMVEKELEKETQELTQKQRDILKDILSRTIKKVSSKEINKVENL